LSKAYDKEGGIRIIPKIIPSLLNDSVRLLVKLLDEKGDEIQIISGVFSHENLPQNEQAWKRCQRYANSFIIRHV
jgi:hypothetical protein